MAPSKKREVQSPRGQARNIEIDLQVVEIVLEDLQDVLAKIIKALKDANKSLKWALEEIEE